MCLVNSMVQRFLQNISTGTFMNFELIIKYYKIVNAAL